MSKLLKINLNIEMLKAIRPKQLNKISINKKKGYPFRDSLYNKFNKLKF